MFDVGFWELTVIFVVGLLVLGPERLPRVATRIGQWTGKARRMARILTTQLQEEANAIDPRRIMDPAPARSPEPAWNRPGVEDLKAGEAAAGETAPGADARSEASSGPPARP
jgi:Tat protein translocase TatB subunit